jgi:hypothetical protein
VGFSASELDTPTIEEAVPTKFNVGTGGLPKPATYGRPRFEVRFANCGSIMNLSKEGKFIYIKLNTPPAFV